MVEDITMSDMMDPTDIFDADEIDNAIKIIENEIEAVKKNEVAEVKPEEQVKKEEYSVDSLITKALKYVENTKEVKRVIKMCEDKLKEHKKYIEEYGVDMPEIVNFTLED